MLLSIAILFLLITAIALPIIRLTRTNPAYIWLTAAAGALLAWINIGALQFRAPLTVTFPVWQPQALYKITPSLILNSNNWALALSVTTLGLAIILTSPARRVQINFAALMGVLFLTGLGLTATLAANPLTLLLAWTALDLTEMIITLRTFEKAEQGANAITAFVFRLIGSGLFIWGSLTNASTNLFTDFNSALPAAAMIYLLIGAWLRLGIFPLHLPYGEELNLRRGLGTALRLITAASALVLLIQFPQQVISSGWIIFFSIVFSLSALYGGWNWLRADDELNSRPYWIITLASFAFICALFGNSTGVIAWGCALLLGGGLIFLYSSRSIQLTRFILLSLFGLTALPFSLTASALEASHSIPWYLFIFLIPAQAFLLAGTARHITKEETNSFAEQPRWTQTIYPLGFGILLFVEFLLGIWGWDGAASLGGWIVSLLTTLLAVGILILRSRIKTLGAYISPRPARQNILIQRIYQLGIQIYEMIGGIFKLIASTLEGEGGILWAALILIVFATLIQGLN